MKQQTDKSTIGLAIGTSVIGLAGVLAIGALTFNALSNAAIAHADALYSQQTTLVQKYKASIDAYNDGIDMAEHNAGLVLPKDNKTESLDSLEVAGVDTSHIVQKSDGTMVYMIQSGDTLTSISATLGYSVDEIANFNQIRNVNLIYANSALRVPKE